MRRTLMVAVTAALATGFALLGAPAAQAAPAGGPGTDAYTPPAIKWGPCDNARLKSAKAECGFVVVPLDYTQPKGATIKIAVSRVKHTVPDAQSQGPILFNPGGPGGSGLAFAAVAASLPGGVSKFYDAIGFDPRGVGASVPKVSCIPDYAGYNRPDYEPDKTPGTIDVWSKKAAGYAQACKKNGPILNHLTTLDSVRDMDSIRKALGAPKITYYGFSYGTYLGQVYGTVYPTHLRRAVFDGVVRASGVWYDDNIDQDIAFQKNIEIYFDWVAKHDAVYHLGTSGPDVEKLYYSTQDKLRKDPAGGKIGPAEWNDVFLQAGYYVYGWEEIAQVFSGFVKTGDPKPLIDLYDNTNDTTDDNGYAIYLGVQCTDTPWPGQAKALADNFRVAKKAPFETWANGWFNAPCASWPAKAGRPVTIDGSRAPGILMINETFDAATPFSGALEARRLFPKSALIEGVGGTTHAGSLSDSACTENAIAAYLTNGTLPKRLGGNRSDAKCAPVPQPDPKPGAAPAPGGGT